MTREEVIVYLTQMAEAFNKRAAKQGGEKRKELLIYMNTCAEAAVLLMEDGKMEDDRK